MYAEQQVRAGIAFLDEKIPSWRQRIDWAALDMHDGQKCVLGQLFPHFDAHDNVGYDRATAELNLTPEEASALGFYRSDGFWSAIAAHELEGLDEPSDRARHSWNRRYDLLADTWKQIMEPQPA